MPMMPPHCCPTPGCRALAPYGQARCDVHEGKQERAAEQARGSAHARGYDARWNKERLIYLLANPLCVNCLKHKRITPARVVDHIIDHKGNQDLFWDKNNWQSLCDYTSPYNCHGHKSKKTGEMKLEL